MALFQVFSILPESLTLESHNGLGVVTHSTNDYHDMNCLLSIIYASRITLAFLIGIQFSF